MSQKIDIRYHQQVWYYECGNIMENQQTGEQYLIIENLLEDIGDDTE